VEGSRKRGDPELQLMLARAYRAAGDFVHSAKHFLHAENPKEFAEMLFEWSQQGYPSESDLFLARAVLQYVSACWNDDRCKGSKPDRVRCFVVQATESGKPARRQQGARWLRGAEQGCEPFGGLAALQLRAVPAAHTRGTSA
jgi:hypothetical protein